MHTLLLQAVPDSFNVNMVSELLKQSPLITALLVGLKYLYNRQKDLEAKRQADADKLEAYMKEDRQILLEALNNNTRVMQEMEAFLKDIKNEK